MCFAGVTCFSGVTDTGKAGFWIRICSIQICSIQIRIQIQIHQKYQFKSGSKSESSKHTTNHAKINPLMPNVTFLDQSSQNFQEQLILVQNEFHFFIFLIQACVKGLALLRFLRAFFPMIFFSLFFSEIFFNKKAEEMLNSDLLEFLRYLYLFLRYKRFNLRYFLRCT